MAAITPSNAAISVEDLLMLLHQKFTAALPGYAVPCFLRLTSDIEKTGETSNNLAYDTHLHKSPVQERSK